MMENRLDLYYMTVNRITDRKTTEVTRAVKSLYSRTGEVWSIFHKESATQGWKTISLCVLFLNGRKAFPEYPQLIWPHGLLTMFMSHAQITISIT